jgi:uncharacterized phosphosugar-binding protein
LNINCQPGGTIVKRKYIHIYQCKHGDILADDVFDKSGILIIPKGSVVNEDVIKRLHTFRIRQLTIYEIHN